MVDRRKANPEPVPGVLAGSLRHKIGANCSQSGPGTTSIHEFSRAKSDLPVAAAGGHRALGLLPWRETADVEHPPTVVFLSRHYVMTRSRLVSLWTTCGWPVHGEANSGRQVIRSSTG